jgi:nickel transport protein
MRQNPIFPLFLLLFFLAASPASAHEMRFQVTEGEALTVRFNFPDDDRPYFEAYEIFPPGADSPFQTGRVNAAGEVSFRPDRQGEWRLRVATEDGHGTVVRVLAGAEGSVDWQPLGASRAERILAALGYLLGVFGLLALWRTRRPRPESL